jgi:uncharacterized protein (TIGR02217 family)
MAFLETPRFPDDISSGVVGGPEYSTTVIVVRSGFEQRNSNWSQSRGRWDASHAVRTRAQMEVLFAFFRSVKGKAHGFRFKDWIDYQVAKADGVLGTGVGNGGSTYQIGKLYAAGALSEIRAIRKPVAGTVVGYRNDTPLTVGAGAGQIAIDTTTGLITFQPDVTKTIDANVVKAVDANVAKTITGITQANPGVVTATGHTFTTGDRITHSGIVGMTQLNGVTATVTVIDANTYSLGIDTTAYTAYSSGGTATRYGIAQTNPVWVHADAHTFVNGDLVKLETVGGMTQVNNLYFTVANKTTKGFELSGINGTGYTAYTSGASAIKYGITQTNPVRVYSAAHGRANGSLAYLSGVVGMTQVNGLTFTVANAATDYFDLSGINGTAYSARTSGGTISVFPQITDVLQVSCEFDVPCRFDTDKLEGHRDAGQIYGWNSIPIVEIRA